MNSPSTDTIAPTDPPKSLSGIAKKIDEAKQRHKQELELLNAAAAIFELLPESINERGNIYVNQIDFDGLSREQVKTTIATLQAGKWTKRVNPSQPDLIDYETEIDGIKVRLWAAAPPESCRVIEVEEEVPATTIKRRKLVCSGDVKEAQ